MGGFRCTRSFLILINVLYLVSGFNLPISIDNSTCQSFVGDRCGANFCSSLLPTCLGDRIIAHRWRHHRMWCFPLVGLNNWNNWCRPPSPDCPIFLHDHYFPHLPHSVQRGHRLPCCHCRATAQTFS